MYKNYAIITSSIPTTNSGVTEQTMAEFTRKDYMSVFKYISSATASRDLKNAVELGLIEKKGYKNKTIYRKLLGTTL